ncbi:MAG: cobalamin-dependent protein [Planctomycetota bacterium]
MTDPEHPLRVLIAKPGLDGHDAGARAICRAIEDAGMVAFYTGLRQSPDAIAKAALAHRVDVVGLSILSGAHLLLTERVIEALRRHGAGGVVLIVGGNIPRADVPALQALGAASVFRTGTPFEEIVGYLRREARTARKVNQ